MNTRILTLSESCYQKILTYLEFISNSIYTFTKLLPNNTKYFFERLNGHLKMDRKFSNGKFLHKSEESHHTHMTQTIYSLLLLECT